MKKRHIFPIFLGFVKNFLFKKKKFCIFLGKITVKKMKMYKIAISTVLFTSHLQKVK